MTTVGTLKWPYAVHKTLASAGSGRGKETCIGKIQADVQLVTKYKTNESITL